MEDINPSIWGRSAWTFLHCIIRAYPENPTPEIKDRYKSFLSLIQYMLPCQTCRKNFSADMTKYPLTDNILSTKQGMLDWWVKVRNSEDECIGKHPKTLEGYDSEVFTPKTKNEWIPKVILGVVVILILTIIYFIYKH